jgi:hypothetical protein
VHFDAAKSLDGRVLSCKLSCRPEPAERLLVRARSSSKAYLHQSGMRELDRINALTNLISVETVQGRPAPGEEYSNG